MKVVMKIGKNKVGIITLNGYFNYGNRLQNYALQEVVKNEGYEVETILVEIPQSRKNIIGKIKSALKEVLIPYIRKDIVENRKYHKIRTRRFYDFTQKYIKESSYKISNNAKTPEEIESFYAFITGSDQVWNPLYNMQTSAYFLTFAPKHKRISYAASFGIAELPNESIAKYKKWLSEFNQISIREEAGAKIVQNLTGRDVEVVLDPTLLLTREKWLEVSKKHENKPNNKYLLTYFLGEVSQLNREKILKIAKEDSLEIVDLSNINDKNVYTADPSEFIDYINDASVFITDSFHGSVFSIILEKPFAVLERGGSKKSMNSRIETLLTIFNLKDRMWENISNLNNIKDVDYSNVNNILEKERKKSLDFIKQALNDINN